jgi:hypothetical protein
MKKFSDYYKVILEDKCSDNDLSKYLNLEPLKKLNSYFTPYNNENEKIKELSVLDLIGKYLVCYSKYIKIFRIWIF